MQLEFGVSSVKVIREEGDPKFYDGGGWGGPAAGESRLLHNIKRHLNENGGDFIKKRMWKDGHLVSDYQQYIRVRKPTGSSYDDIAIYSPFFAVRGANEDWNRDGYVVLAVERDMFGKGLSDAS